MQLSEHYELNLIEGTDVVNPLVQDKPNYQKIDTQMYANECASVGTATEIKTGTVHALSRGNGDIPTFRFTATSNFETGDTFTVDGVSVTALLPSGEALQSGAFIIGSEVLCTLKATLLTVYTNGGTSNNTTHFNNQLPAYYLNSANINFDGEDAHIDATNVQSAIKEVRHSKILFTSSTTGTNAQKLTEVYNYYMGLSLRERENCEIRANNRIYPLTHLTLGQFTSSLISGSVFYMNQVQLSNQTFKGVEIKSSGMTIVDYSNDTSDNPFILILT